MRRRALLGSLAAGAVGVPGCSTLASNGSQADGNGTQSDGATTDGSGDGGDGTGTGDEPGGDAPDTEPPESFASVVGLETGPRTYAFAPTRIRTDDGARIGLWFDRTATDDHPARLTGWLENANDFENTFRVEWIPAVGRTHSRTLSGHDHTSRLHLAPTENNDLAESVPEVVRDGSGYWRVDHLGPWMPERRRLDPGERVPLEYVVVGEPEMPGRPTGTYEFRGRDRTVTVTAWDTDSPGPEADSRFAGRSVPDLGGEATVQWYHQADASTVAFVRPSTERVELPGTVTFEAVNNGREGLRCGHWNLHKLVDGEWFHVGPGVHASDCRVLHPGDRKQWTLRAFGGEAVPCGPEGCGGAGLTRGFLGGGEYAAVAGYGHPADRSAALVELVGDPVALSLTDDAEVSRGGMTITVTTERYGDGEHPADGTLTLTRTGDADERVIAEQVMGGSGFGDDRAALRNALAAMDDGVGRVVVRTDEYAVDRAIGHDADVRRFRFRGQAYEAARESAEE